MAPNLLALFSKELFTHFVAGTKDWSNEAYTIKTLN